MTGSSRPRYASLPPLLSGVVAVARQHHVAYAPGVYASALAPFDLEVERFDLVARTFALRGFFEWRIAAIAGVLVRPGDVVFEGGAQMGTESFVYATLVGPEGRVVSFEADPQLAERLIKQADRQGFVQSTVVAKALAEAPGTALFDMAASPEDNWGVGSLAAGESATAIEVELATLDDAMDEFGSPRLLVMDIQGGELGALKGAERVLRDARPVMVLEIEAASLERLGGSAQELFALVQRHGYRSWRLSRFGLREESAPRPDELGDWLFLPQERVAELERPLRSALRRGAWLPTTSRLSPFGNRR